MQTLSVSNNDSKIHKPSWSNLKSVYLPKIQIKKFCANHMKIMNDNLKQRDYPQKKIISNIEKMNYLFFFKLGSDYSLTSAR